MGKQNSIETSMAMVQGHTQSSTFCALIQRVDRQKSFMTPTRRTTELGGILNNASKSISSSHRCSRQMWQTEMRLPVSVRHAGVLSVDVNGVGGDSANRHGGRTQCLLLTLNLSGAAPLPEIWSARQKQSLNKNQRFHVRSVASNAPADCGELSESRGYR